MDLTKKTVEELKVLAYDQMAQQQQIQSNLQAINSEIANKLEEQKKEPKKKEK